MASFSHLRLFEGSGLKFDPFPHPHHLIWQVAMASPVYDATIKVRNVAMLHPSIKFAIQCAIRHSTGAGLGLIRTNALRQGTWRKMPSTST